jgi:hypothetical protein
VVRRALFAAGIAVALLLALVGMVWASGSVQQDPLGRPIIVRWSTESEVNTAGFNIYRSTSEEGPWEKVNPQLIPGSPDPLRGGTYVFTDTAVIAGETYWYELEEVELGGQVTRLERTQATAERQGLGLPVSLPCGSALLILPALGVVFGHTHRSRKRPMEAPS